jgi:uncharacterized membrane protein YphA (DoxX/SURF4 family)
MKYLLIIARIILGAVFLFSGFVKAVDPLGSAYKFSDYFAAFGLGFLEFTTLPLAVLLSSFELVLGSALIAGYRRSTVYRALFWFMLFFTILTLVLAIFNPVSDCGCFGDALVLTNWQTFLKNIFLMAFVLPLFLHRDTEYSAGRAATEWLVISFLFCGAALFSLWNYRHIPLLDFRPYDTGTVIAREMETPEGAPVDQYETTLTYRDRSTGREIGFTMENYPRDTALWEFVSSESRLVNKGFEPPIHDFAIMDGSGEDQVERILADPGFTLLMISHDLSGADREALSIAEEWARLEAVAGDFSFYAVTASTSDRVEEITSEAGLSYPFFAADEIMLKTMIRSNPGFMLIANGTIIGKWGYRDFPSLGELDPEALELSEKASLPVDQESTFLIEAGIFEDFSFNVMEFSRFLPALIYEREAARRERAAVTGFVLSVGFLILLAGSISPIRL